MDPKSTPQPSNLPEQFLGRGAPRSPWRQMPEYPHTNILEFLLRASGLLHTLWVYGPVEKVFFYTCTLYSVNPPRLRTLAAPSNIDWGRNMSRNLRRQWRFISVPAVHSGLILQVRQFAHQNCPIRFQVFRHLFHIWYTCRHCPFGITHPLFRCRAGGAVQKGTLSKYVPSLRISTRVRSGFPNHEKIRGTLHLQLGRIS